MQAAADRLRRLSVLLGLILAVALIPVCDAAHVLPNGSGHADPCCPRAVDSPAEPAQGADARASEDPVSPCSSSAVDGAESDARDSGDPDGCGCACVCHMPAVACAVARLSEPPSHACLPAEAAPEPPSTVPEPSERPPRPSV